MDKRTTFNEDEFNYDRYRPDYPEALFQDILTYAALDKDSCLLEIGIGTGQATQPFLEKGFQVQAVELGDKLCRYVQNKYANYPNFQAMHADFMEAELEEESFDLIYCATAFHWLPQPASLQKVINLLKKGGTLALFWNHPFPNRSDDATNQVNQAIYQKYRPSDKKQVEFSEKDTQKWEKELKQAGFKEVTSCLYHRTRTLSSDDYIGLLNTYSDHRLLDSAIKTQFEKDMKQALDEIGGEIHIYDTIDLYLAKKLNK